MQPDALDAGGSATAPPSLRAWTPPPSGRPPLPADVRVSPSPPAPCVALADAPAPPLIAGAPPGMPAIGASPALSPNDAGLVPTAPAPPVVPARSASGVVWTGCPTSVEVFSREPTPASEVRERTSGSAQPTSAAIAPRICTVRWGRRKLNILPKPTEAHFGLPWVLKIYCGSDQVLAN